MPVPRADVALIDDTVAGDERTITVRIESEAGRIVVARIHVEGEIIALASDGRQVDLSSYDWAGAGGYPIVNPTMSSAGWELRITLGSPEPIFLKIEEAWDGLPPEATEGLQPRPNWTMPAPDYARDPTIVKQTFTF